MSLILMLSLLVFSCGKNNITPPLQGPSASTSSSAETEPASSSDTELIPHEILNHQVFALEGISRKLQNHNAEVGSLPHLIVKDKAIQRYFSCQKSKCIADMDGSFLFGDDYRFSYLSNFVDHWKFYDFVRGINKREHNELTSFDLVFSGNKDIRNVTMLRGGFDFRKDIPVPLAEKEIRRWEENDLVFDDQFLDLSVEFSTPAGDERLLGRICQVQR